MAPGAIGLDQPLATGRSIFRGRCNTGQPMQSTKENQKPQCHRHGRNQYWIPGNLN
jgi:hypothetical protein